MRQAAALRRPLNRRTPVPLSTQLKAIIRTDEPVGEPSRKTRSRAKAGAAAMRDGSTGSEVSIDLKFVQASDSSWPWRYELSGKSLESRWRRGPSLKIVPVADVVEDVAGRVVLARTFGLGSLVQNLRFDRQVFQHLVGRAQRRRDTGQFGAVRIVLSVVAQRRLDRDPVLQQPAQVGVAELIAGELWTVQPRIRQRVDVPQRVQVGAVQLHIGRPDVAGARLC